MKVQQEEVAQTAARLARDISPRMPVVRLEFAKALYETSLDDHEIERVTRRGWRYPLYICPGCGVPVGLRYEPGMLLIDRHLRRVDGKRVMCEVSFSFAELIFEAMPQWYLEGLA